MCGGYILQDAQWTTYHEDLAQHEPEDFRPHYNLRPSMDAPILFKTPKGLSDALAQWWFVPEWHKRGLKDWKATTFNARIEEAKDKPAFRDAWKNNRCLIPASGYYEWTGNKRNKQAWFVSLKQNTPVFYFAGLYATHKSGQITYTVLTRNASSDIVELHQRMPVILNRENTMRWLNHEDNDQDVIKKYGRNLDAPLQFWTIGAFRSRDNSPRMIQQDDFGF